MNFIRKKAIDQYQQKGDRGYINKKGSEKESRV